MERASVCERERQASAAKTVEYIGGSDQEEGKMECPSLPLPKGVEPVPAGRQRGYPAPVFVFINLQPLKK